MDTSKNETSKKFLTENYCEICDYQSSRSADFKKHTQSKKHIKNVEDKDNATKKQRKPRYVCETCDFNTDRKGNYNTHLQSLKHLEAVKSTATSKLECQHCNKLYSGTNNLWKHMKFCQEIKKEEEEENPYEPYGPYSEYEDSDDDVEKRSEKEEEPEKDESDSEDEEKEKSDEEDEEKEEKEDESCSESEEDDEESSKSAINRNKSKKRGMFMEVIRKSDEIQKLLIKQNEELMRHVLEMAKQQQTNISNTISNTNSNNNSNNTAYTQFNLQVFLNEQCKDALDIMDFVDSLDIQVSDLEETGKLGFIDGITRIIVNGLNKLDLYKRPIHCTDLKREIMYLKDKNTWGKEGDGKPLLKKAVNRVSNMNFRQLRKWQELHPGYDIVDTKQNDDYIHLSTQAIGCCSSQENDRNMDKIMKKLCKEVALDKKDGSLNNVR